MNDHSKPSWLARSKSWIAILTILFSLAAIFISLYSLRRNQQLILKIEAQELAIERKFYQENLLRRANRIKNALDDLRLANSEYSWVCANQNSVNNFGGSINKLNNKRKEKLEKFITATGDTSLEKIFNTQIYAEYQCLAQQQNQLYLLQKGGVNCPVPNTIEAPACNAGVKQYDGFCKIVDYKNNEQWDEFEDCFNKDIADFLLSNK
jgi:hypothetical protein